MSTETATPFPVKPKASHIVVEPLDPKTKTAGGIHIPKEAQEQTLRGIVRAVGGGKFNPATGQTEPVDVSVGETVLFKKFAGTPIMVGDVRHLVMLASDIVATV